MRSATPPGGPGADRLLWGPVASTPRIKVCGLARPSDARVALQAGADWLGVVLAPSPRRVPLERARELVARVPGPWVGVFVNAGAEDVARAAEALDLAAVQLHGDESPAEARRIRALAGLPVWKAVAWTGDPAPVAEWAGIADAVLLDAGGGARRGGTGRTLPWDAIAGRLPAGDRPVPLVLAGGLDAANVARAIETVAPDGVDASSRLETAPGVKDPDRVRAYVEAALEARGAGCA